MVYGSIPNTFVDLLFCFKRYYVFIIPDNSIVNDYGLWHIHLSISFCKWHVSFDMVINTGKLYSRLIYRCHWLALILKYFDLHDRDSWWTWSRLCPFHCRECKEKWDPNREKHGFESHSPRVLLALLSIHNNKNKHFFANFRPRGLYRTTRKR